MFATVERLYELESLRRSLAMLAPQAPAGLSREDAIRLIGEVQDAQRRLKKLVDGIQRLLNEEERARNDHPPARSNQGENY
jgi:hypothetical protein